MRPTTFMPPRVGTADPLVSPWGPADSIRRVAAALRAAEQAAQPPADRSAEFCGAACLRAATQPCDRLCWARDLLTRAAAVRATTAPAPPWPAPTAPAPTIRPRGPRFDYVALYRERNRAGGWR